MNPVMLGDFSARSMGMTLADHIRLQRATATRYRRRRRAPRGRVRPDVRAPQRDASPRPAVTGARADGAAAVEPDVHATTVPLVRG
ncbi:hypothetical protein [Georgenia wangjunii]|uniref:hypothetical protein n=1 Tax=Georgenia wangjunii TaxID=3117730 RepID=UPI002F2640B6